MKAEIGTEPRVVPKRLSLKTYRVSVPPLSYLQTFLPSAANLTSLATITDSHGAATTSTQANISVSALSTANIQALLMETAVLMQTAVSLNETAFSYALLVAAEIAQLPSAEQDPAITGRSNTAPARCAQDPLSPTIVYENENGLAL
jgi:hypothetical protein